MIRSPRRSFPVWAKWALSLGIGAILLVALVVFVEHNDGNGEAAQSNAAVARANREAEIVVAQDQAPHVVTLGPGVGPETAIAGTVRIAMSRLVAHGIVTGPLQKVTCARAGGTRARPGFTCTATAADVRYPFLGVVDTAARRLTLCKRDQPPVPSMDIPVSPRCRAAR